MVDQAISEHRVAEGSADERCHHRVSQGHAAAISIHRAKTFRSRKRSRYISSDILMTWGTLRTIEVGLAAPNLAELFWLNASRTARRSRHYRLQPGCA